MKQEKMIENKHSVLILPHLRLIHLLYILHSPSLCSDTPKYSNISFLVIMRCKFFKVKIENHFLMEFLYTSSSTYMIQTFGIPLHPSPHAPSLVLWRPWPFTNKLPTCELQRRTLTVHYKDTRRRNSRHETFPLLSYIVRLIACGTAYCFVYSVHLFFRVYSCLFACFR